MDDFDRYRAGSAQDAISIASLNAKIRPDPILQYLAATALSQEVTILNNYVTSAAIPAGYRPFIVRLQVSLLPLARNQPYDVYTTLSFLPTSLIGGKLALPPDIQSRPVRVIPLLVTDNLEAIVRSSSQDRIRQLTLALQLVNQLAGGSVSFDAQSEQITKSLTREYSSIMTVARASDNSVRVRFGAAVTGDNEYATLARTHNVTVVLLVSNDALKAKDADITVVGKTEMADALTGKILPQRTREQMIETAGKAVRVVCGVSSSAAVLASDRQALTTLVDAAQGNDFKTFLGVFSAPSQESTTQPASFSPERLSHETSTMRDYSALTPFQTRLWVEFVSMRVQSLYSQTNLQLGFGREGKRHLPDLSKDSSVEYDVLGGDVTMVIRSGHNLFNDEIDAFIDAEKGGALAATSIDVDPLNYAMRLRFDAREFAKRQKPVLKIRLIGLNSDEAEDGGIERTYSLKPVELTIGPRPPTKDEFSIAVKSQAPVGRDGAMMAEFSYEQNESGRGKDYYLDVRGAVVNDAHSTYSSSLRSPPVSTDPRYYQFIQMKGRVRFSLTPDKAGTKVELHVLREDDSEAMLPVSITPEYVDAVELNDGGRDTAAKPAKATAATTSVSPVKSDESPEPRK